MYNNQMEVWKDTLKGTLALQLFLVLSKDDMTDESDLNGAIGTVSYKYALYTLLLVHMSGVQWTFRSDINFKNVS